MVVVIAPVALVIAVTAIISALIVVSSGWVLTFLVTPLGPTVKFVVSKLVAIVAFDISFVSFLGVCSEGFIWAILALLVDAAVILISDKLSYSVQCYWCPHLVSCSINRMNDRLVGRRE